MRGPWVTSSYYRDPDPERFHDGWLRTGDVGTLDERRFMQITDRTKDVIKSGGEWISSVELEGAVMAHPDVFEAAVIAIPDSRWEERPLVCVVPVEGRSPTAEELVDFLQGRVARWWLPERWAFVDAIPKTSVGKFDKKVLQAADHARATGWTSWRWPCPPRAERGAYPGSGGPLVHRVDQLTQPGVVQLVEAEGDAAADRHGRCPSAREGTARRGRMDPALTMSANLRLSSASSSLPGGTCRRSTSRSPTHRQEW